MVKMSLALLTHIQIFYSWKKDSYVINAQHRERFFKITFTVFIIDWVSRYQKKVMVYSQIIIHLKKLRLNLILSVGSHACIDTLTQCS